MQKNKCFITFKYAKIRGIIEIGSFNKRPIKKFTFGKAENGNYAR